MNTSTITIGRSALFIAAVVLVVGCSSAGPTPTIAPSAKPPTAAPSPTVKPPTPAPTPSPSVAPSPSTPPVLPSPSAPVAANPIAVFGVTGETFRIELVGADNLAHARALLAGAGDGPIPNGILVLGDDGGVNAPWSWHIDPATLEWADMTTEVCDGSPSQIQDGTFSYERFCPWSARLSAIE